MILLLKKGVDVKNRNCAESLDNIRYFRRYLKAPLVSRVWAVLRPSSWFGFRTLDLSEVRRCGEGAR